MRASITVRAILAAFGPRVAAAQVPQACTLITTEELKAAFGGTGDAHKTELQIPSGPAKGQTMNGCMWSIGEQGMLTLSVMPAMKGAAREAGIAQLRQVYASLLAKGWTEEKKEIPGGNCSQMTPPASEKDAPMMVGCMAEAKGQAISIGTLGKTKYSIEQVKPFFDKVVKRIH